ncbi:MULTISPECIES: DUF6355 family natural product biosynthesis protein [Rhodococcus]|uniref:DUF6355 family natural product biosynthesis protein n=1 Tax=Rhodococcus TaxID=1827 RepID=UPI0013173E6B|nr:MULTISPECIES: DUF6355 family natural product biosynthesis protein [Rhodococcus]QDC17469.2 hypothetical protein E2561_25125 [Rhodococcus ruber]WKX02113.1 DUF6355 family natural product biosynthesis protein [Rhodococcus aetherivorans]
MSRGHKTVARVAAAAVATVGIGAGLAVATPAVASAAPCGFYTDAGRHWYNHCGGGWVKINIHWDNFLGPDRNETRCVGPGITQIGTPSAFQRIDGAWYIGGC